MRVDLDRIQVVVHPQSVIHSAGAVCGRCGDCPARCAGHEAAHTVCTVLSGQKIYAGEKGWIYLKLGQMTFEKPDPDTFTGLALAYEAARVGGSMPTVYNAANEKAVALFLDRKIRYLQIH